MKIPLIFYKITRYEYWPMWLFYLPVFPYYLFLAIKCRSWSFFTASNPGIYLGGFFGESKKDILGLINDCFLPKTVYINSSDPIADFIDKISFPVIAKPDVGERGNGVEKLYSHQELLHYHEKQNKTTNCTYLLQEYVDFELEFGVFYSRLPGSINGIVSSLTGKDFMNVTGDGHKSIHELMQENTRYRFQIDRFVCENSSLMETVLLKNENRILEPIGNHCRGTRFINNNELINQKLNDIFDEISKDIKGFYFGRFDLKVKSVEDLYAGKNIKIMELNGASSEPGHVYDVNYSLRKAYKDICWHWNRLAEISLENIKKGTKPATFSEIWKMWKL
jgi:hypothetical protein